MLCVTRDVCYVLHAMCVMCYTRCVYSFQACVLLVTHLIVPAVGWIGGGKVVVDFLVLSPRILSMFVPEYGAWFVDFFAQIFTGFQFDLLVGGFVLEHLRWVGGFQYVQLVDGFVWTNLHWVGGFECDRLVGGFVWASLHWVGGFVWANLHWVGGFECDRLVGGFLFEPGVLVYVCGWFM